MSNLPEENLPLYLQCEHYPIYTYIINNNVVCLQETAGSAGDMKSSLGPLMMLYANSLTRKVFPEKIRPHLDAILKENWKRHCGFCVCGNGPNFPEDIMECLALKITVTPREDGRVVTVHDFALIEHAPVYDHKVYNLPWSIQLTAEEAFLNFANVNLCNNFFCQDLYDTTRTRMRAIETSVYHDTITNHLHLFLLDYVEWLRDQLQTQTISCSKVLQQSGALVLAGLCQLPIVTQYIEEAMTTLQTHYDQLSRNQKIQYFLLLRICDWCSPSVETFSQENQPLLDNLRKELLTPYPKFPAIKENTSIMKMLKKYGLWEE